MAIALWICPPKDSQSNRTLSALLDSLSPLFQDSPHFEPHITITSQLAINSPSDVVTVLTAAHAALKNVKVDVLFTDLTINNRNGYFKKVFLRCQRNSVLVGLATIIRELYVELPTLNVELDAKYKAQEWAAQWDPHVSLIYTESKVDSAQIRTMEGRIKDYFDCGPEFQANTPDALTDYELGWNGGVLRIVRCEGPVEQWEILGTVEIR